MAVAAADHVVAAAAVEVSLPPRPVIDITPVGTGDDLVAAVPSMVTATRRRSAAWRRRVLPGSRPRSCARC